MMNLFQRAFKQLRRDIVSRKKVVSKQEGSTLVITLILCGMIITVGLGVVRILVSELQFSADLLWSERSYFAAESGVESALLELKDDPILHIPPSENIYEIEDLDGAQTDISIQNRLDETNNIIKIPKASAVKLKLITDTNLPQLEWKISGDGESAEAILWKILCPEGSALGGRKGFTEEFESFGNESGDLQDSSSETRTVVNFWNNLSIDKTTCWFSIQNISSNGSFVSIEINPDGAKYQ